MKTAQNLRNICPRAFPALSHQKGITDMFKDEVLFAAAHAPQWLGRPEPLRLLDQEIDLCHSQIRKNTPVLLAITASAKPLDSAIFWSKSNIAPLFGR